jgi:hypothetical protein
MNAGTSIQDLEQRIEALVREHIATSRSTPYGAEPSGTAGRGSACLLLLSGGFHVSEYCIRRGRSAFLVDTEKRTNVPGVPPSWENENKILNSSKRTRCV